MSARFCVAVADARRARIFRLWEPEYDDLGERRRLVEVIDLVHPARGQRASEAFTDTRPGLHRGSGRGAPAHAVDDHRGAHRDEDERVFAAQVMDEVARVARELGAHHLVLAAAPHMLGSLRSHTRKLESGADLLELAQELTRLTPSQLYDHLAKQNVLP